MDVVIILKLKFQIQNAAAEPDNGKENAEAAEQPNSLGWRLVVTNWSLLGEKTMSAVSYRNT